VVGVYKESPQLEAKHSLVEEKMLESGRYNFRHVPPTQLSPAVQELPQRPQFCESLMKVPMFTHLPMHVSVPGAQPQNPPVQVSEKEQRFPHRPQFWASLTNAVLSTHLPSHHS
jgi:hypothetical protein